MTHRQVALPELGFTVDEGLEEIIRACWRRGIPTLSSCIGGFYRDDAEIIFDGDGATWIGERWEQLTGRDYDVTETSSYTYIAAEFPATDIPDLVEMLQTVEADIPPLDQLRQLNAAADRGEHVDYGHLAKHLCDA
jgi:hypothetical protein